MILGDPRSGFSDRQRSRFCVFSFLKMLLLYSWSVVSLRLWDGETSLVEFA